MLCRVMVAANAWAFLGLAPRTRGELFLGCRGCGFRVKDLGFRGSGFKVWEALVSTSGFRMLILYLGLLDLWCWEKNV